MHHAGRKADFALLRHIPKEHFPQELRPALTLPRFVDGRDKFGVQVTADQNLSTGSLVRHARTFYTFFFIGPIFLLSTGLNSLKHLSKQPTP